MDREQRDNMKRILYSAVLCDVMDGMGYRNQAISKGLMPLKEDVVIFGPAFTSIGTQVYSMPEEPLIAQCDVLDQLSEGEVYVLANRGEYTCAVFGELLATAVSMRKVDGVLIDGYARDLRELRKMNFPMLFRGTNPKTSKGRCEINECKIPVVIDGVEIRQGDYIFGDVDGIAVIPEEIVDKVLEEALCIVKKENTVRERLLSGGSLRKAYTEIGAI